MNNVFSNETNIGIKIQCLLLLDQSLAEVVITGIYKDILMVFFYRPGLHVCVEGGGGNIFLQLEGTKSSK